MFSSSVPATVAAVLVPMGLAVTVSSLPFLGGFGSLLMMAVAVGTQLYFSLLAVRQYRTLVTTLEFRAEKDTLIAELEQAKANSDEARRRAEDASLAKSRFLATMSHELRTPLNAILGFSEVMKEEVLGSLQNQTYRDYAGDIHASGRHLLTLINEILDLSRIEAGRYELSEEALLLGDIVEESRHLLGLRAKSRGLQVSLEIQPGLPKVWADERAMRQVVLNLMSNAIKYTHPGGEIVVRVGWTARGGQYASVGDNGPGIPEAEIPVVLASFGRGSLAIKTAEQGSGLGLPIVKGLIELHGGTLTLTSKLREGTEVVVTLPPSRVVDALSPIDRSGDAAGRPKAA